MNKINLTTILDTVRNQKDLTPKAGQTFCNVGLDRIMALLGLPRFTSPINGQPILANDMIEVLENSSDYEKVAGFVACARAMKGVFVVACQCEAMHGHVAAVYPAAMEYSGSWKKEVPMLNNIGKQNGVLRASQCFRIEPDYYSRKL